MRYAIALLFVLLALRAQRLGDDLAYYASLILATIWLVGA